MASKRRNMFHKNKTQETTEKGIVTYANPNIFKGSRTSSQEKKKDVAILPGTGRRQFADLQEKKRAEDGGSPIPGRKRASLKIRTGTRNKRFDQPALGQIPFLGRVLPAQRPCPKLHLILLVLQNGGWYSLANFGSKIESGRK
ncbi:hypothetical protein AAG570_001281 [Ranatra chinensis]|uniref:Uncharacterized protein n=1 Tax=Ranatra chinensis TaxID=642074 RepID=A0ABD0YQ86_9HEMI